MIVVSDYWYQVVFSWLSVICGRKRCKHRFSFLPDYIQPGLFLAGLFLPVYSPSGQMQDSFKRPNQHTADSAEQV